VELNSAWAGIIVAIGGSVFVHILTAVWWASKINATLGFLEKTILALNDTIVRHDANRYTVNDATKDFSIRDEQIKAAHRRIDDLVGSR